MDHRHYSPAGLSESELDESSSTASSPMSISSVEANSPYDSSRLNGGDEDPTDSSFSTSVNSPSSSPSSPSESICNDNYPTQWSNPYGTGTKSVRWFRDDRGLWSERSSNRRSPYNRNTSSSHTTKQHNVSNHKEMSEVLIEAVQREDQVELRHLLAKSATHVNILGQEGDSPLHRSCRKGNLDTVKLLVRYGADPELANREGWSPLHLAAHSGYHDVALYLLSLSRRLDPSALRFFSFDPECHKVKY